MTPNEAAKACMDFRDVRRDRAMSEHGISTLRFRNDEVICNIARVLERILQHPSVHISRRRKAA